MSLQTLQDNIRALAAYSLPDLPLTRRLGLSGSESTLLAVNQEIDFCRFRDVEPALQKVNAFYLDVQPSPKIKAITVDNIIWCVSYRLAEEHLSIDLFDAHTEDYLETKRVALGETGFVLPQQIDDNVILWRLYNANNGAVWVTYRLDMSNGFIAFLVGSDFTVKRFESFENENYFIDFKHKNKLFHGLRSGSFNSFYEAFKKKYPTVRYGYWVTCGMFGKVVVGMFFDTSERFYLGFYNKNFKIIQVPFNYSSQTFFIRNDGTLFMNSFDNTRFYKFV